MTLPHVAEATGGELIFPENDKESYEGKVIDGAVIDNRLIKKDFLFIPIRGQKVDGHKFIDSAFEAGALAVLSDHVLDSAKGPFIVVKDTEQALKDLATYYREQLTIPIIGIIGSVGKTSTKEMVASVLTEKYKVLKTEGNFNNEIGLPLTICRIGDEHEVAVVEMGISDFGEMHRLGEIAKPNIVVMTNIGQAHLENLKTRDGILKAKTEVFEHMKEASTVILNGDDDKLSTVSDACGAKIIFYGTKDQQVLATDITPVGIEGIDFVLHTKKGDGRVHISIPGEHNVLNALAAASVGLELGLEFDEIVKGIESSETIAGRSNFIHANGMVIMDDCYNASPSSMEASLKVLSYASGRKIAVLGDMGELGADAAKLHYSVGKAVIKNGIDILFTAGQLSKEIARAVREEINIEVYSYDNKDEMINELEKLVKPGDTILVKASHFMNFTEVVSRLEVK